MNKMNWKLIWIVNEQNEQYSSNSSTNKTNKKYKNIWFLYNKWNFFYKSSRSISISKYYIWYNYFFIINTIIFYYFRSSISNVFKHFTKFKFTKFIQSHLKIHKIRQCNWFKKRNRNTLNVFQNVYNKTTQHF